MRFYLLVASLWTTVCGAGEIYSIFPERIDPNASYVFYSHGFIVEGDNPRPEHPRWGVYDFPKVVLGLSDSDYHLIAYHRTKDTDPDVFAGKLASDVNALLSAGVTPSKITLVGFSRGGAITILVSNQLTRDDINFVILAGCGKYLDSNSELKLHGAVYSVREASDDLVGSCQALVDRSPGVTQFSERVIDTGKEHAAFYQPLPEWTAPVKSWIKRDARNVNNSQDGDTIND
ncbi:alpha/beta hydrolase [Arenicella chitinivorans]|nr:alpha/beta hydrolase [Arenicella chitinivorans]